MAGITRAGYGWTLRKICFKIPRRNPYFYIPQKRIFMAEQEEKKRNSSVFSVYMDDLFRFIMRKGYMERYNSS